MKFPPNTVKFCKDLPKLIDEIKAVTKHNDRRNKTRRKSDRRVYDGESRRK